MKIVEGKARIWLFILLLLVLAIPAVPMVSVQGSAVPVSQGSGTVILANFDVPVDLGSSSFMGRVVSTAISENATAIVIIMNTPGGLGSDLLSIISSIDEANQSGIAVYTYVPSNSLAASAGSYIAMECNKIIMGSGSEIGPSTPIVEGGTDLEQNHTEAAFLQIMVSQAQRWGRNETDAYNMVINDQAFTSNDAYNDHLIDGLANSTDQALATLGLSAAPTQSMSENLYEQLLSALSDSTIDGLLILFGFIAILLELYHPTIALGAVGVIAIIAGLVGSEDLGASTLGFVLIAIAAVLILIELKLGHGFSVITGVIVGSFGIFYLSQGLVYSPAPNIAMTEIELFILIVAGVVGGLYIRWIIGPIRHRRAMTGPETLVGKTGVVTKDLKPIGEVRVEGIIWRARAASGEISSGEAIKVTAVEQLTLVVEEAEPEEPSSANQGKGR
jgi:membrane-bound serine protease (ClpP class)